VRVAQRLFYVTFSNDLLIFFQSHVTLSPTQYKLNLRNTHTHTRTHMLAASKLYYGLMTKDMRNPALQYAVKAMWTLRLLPVTNNMIFVYCCRHSSNRILNYPLVPDKLRALQTNYIHSFEKHDVEMFILISVKCITDIVSDAKILITSTSLQEHPCKNRLRSQ
jgi:hypothetical protein